MKAKLLIASAILLSTIGCGGSSEKSNMDTTTDSANSMTSYPADTMGGYGTSGDSANYNNRNLSADDSAGVRGAGGTGGNGGGTGGDTGTNH